MRDLHIQPSELALMPPLRKVRLGLYLHEISKRQAQLMEESKKGYGLKNRDKIKVAHPEIDEFIRKKNIEEYGTETVDRFSYIPKYTKKLGKKK